MSRQRSKRILSSTRYIDKGGRPAPLCLLFFQGVISMEIIASAIFGRRAFTFGRYSHNPFYLQVGGLSIKQDLQTRPRNTAGSQCSFMKILVRYLVTICERFNVFSEDRRVSSRSWIWCEALTLTSCGISTVAKADKCFGIYPPIDSFPKFSCGFPQHCSFYNPLRCNTMI
jgi:hypothetical protein